MANVLFIRLRSPVTGQWLAHPDLRGKLVAAALEKDSNLTDVCIEILSRRCGVPFTPGSRKTKPPLDVNILNLGPVSAELWGALEIGARQAGFRSAQDGARILLCQHFGLRVQPPVRRGRRPRRAAAA